MLITSNSQGGHGHGYDSGLRPGGGGGGAWGNLNEVFGAHTHTITVNLNIEYTYIQMSAWYQSSGIQLIPASESDVYILYESETPPNSEWTHETTLRGGMFRMPASDVAASKSSPAASINATGTTSSAGGHDHQSTSQCNSCPREWAYHYATAGAHTHTCNHTTAWWPPFYVLALMKYTG
jgi:hypothetical protein